MSERIPFPITDEMARAELKPFRHRGFMKSSMVQLTLVRFREFIREPEAVFWTFIFPILLAAGLGIAFRQRGPDKVQVGVVTGTPASAAVIQSLTRDSTLVVSTYDDSAAALALRTGKVALLVVPGSAKDSVHYVYDRGRSEAVNARLMVDRAVQTGAGRVDAVRATDTYVTEAGSRYIDFLIPGLLGMNLMGSSIWGLGFSIVTARSKKLLKRLMATPMSRAQYLLSYLCSRLVFLILEVVTLVGFGHWAFGVPLRGSLATLFLICVLAAIPFAGALASLDIAIVFVATGLLTTSVLTAYALAPAILQAFSSGRIWGRVAALFKLAESVGIAVGATAVGVLSDHLAQRPGAIGAALAAALSCILAITAVILIITRRQVREA